MMKESLKSQRISAIKLTLLARKLRSEVQGIELLNSDPIAIIGMGCRFPGGGVSPLDFWKLLENGIDIIREVPSDRWDIDAFFDPDPSAPGKVCTRYGGFLDGIDQFDADFFSISPREAAAMDPQQRLLLEVVWEALADAGYPSTRLEGTRTGIYISVYNNDYANQLYNDAYTITAYTSSGTAHSISSGRISYLLDLKGPCMTVDTACSSSLMAVHLAVQGLRNGECEQAVVGGVNLVLSPEQTISLSKWGMLSPDGRCKTFDSTANGFVRGEGCGVIVLKRLGNALEMGDRILAVIRGTAVNHDGRSNNLTAPNGVSQEDVIRSALQNACVDPSQIGYIEAHGTGTSLGDPIEVEAIKNVIGSPRSSGLNCLLGSVKTNIGHLEAAAGIAGLIKVVLSMQYEQIPPHLHFQKLNSYISLEGSSLAITPDGCSWPAGDEPRFAGVSSFGFGGTNVHIVVEEAPRVPVVTEDAASPQLLLLSARSTKALIAAASDFHLFLSDGSGRDCSLRDICYTASVLRNHYTHRIAFAANSHDEMADKIAEWLKFPLFPDVDSETRTEPRIGFVFSGQGAQWHGMGCELLEQDPLFREHIILCDNWLQRNAGWSLLEIFTDPQKQKRLDETEFQQPALLSIQVALAARWQSLGVQPHAVAGHSVGEVAAAVVSGALNLEQALKVVMNRGRLMQKASGNGMMVAVMATPAQTSRLIYEYGEKITIAAFNGPSAVTLTGNADLMPSVLKKLEHEGYAFKVLPVDCAFHSQHMFPFKHELEAAIEDLSPVSETIPIFSTVTGEKIDGRLLDAPYWGRNLCEPVAFTHAVDKMVDQGCTIFLEIGPHPVLLPFVAQTLEVRGAQRILLPSMRRGKPEHEILLETAGKLYTHRCRIQWRELYNEKGHCVSLPAYPWQRERYWAGPAGRSSSAAPVGGGDTHPLLGTRIKSPLLESLVYQSTVSSGRPEYLKDHRISDHCVMPGMVMLEMALAATAATFGSRMTGAGEHGQLLPLKISGFSVIAPLVLDGEAECNLQFELNQKNRTANFRLFSESGISNRWTMHATGTISLDESMDQPKWPTSLDQAREICSSRQEVETLYAGFGARGLNFGNRFKAITSLWVGQNSVLGSIELPPFSDDGSYFIHPVLLDACCQVTGMLLPPLLDGVDPPLYLPAVLSSLTLFRLPVGRRLWSCARLSPINLNDDQVDAEIAVFDDYGNRIAHFEGLRLIGTGRTEMQTVQAQSMKDSLYEITWKAQPVKGRDLGKDNCRLWILLGGCGTGDRLADHLVDSGERFLQVKKSKAFKRLDESRFQMDPTNPDHLKRLLGSAVSGENITDLCIVYLLALDLPSQGERLADMVASEIEYLPCASALNLVKVLAVMDWQGSTKLCLVTRGARNTNRKGEVLDAFQAPLWGLGAVIALEHPELNCLRIDLDSAGADDQDAMLLVRELAIADPVEPEVAYRGGDRLVPRLASLKTLPRDRDAVGTGASRPLVLKASENGLIEDLKYAPATRRPPGQGEVEIAVTAVGLNFRDVLNALNMLPGAAMPLGGECAGRIVTVGEGVEGVTPGDEVLAFALDAFRTYVTVNQSFIVPKPQTMDFVEAASIPVVFLTAYYALRHLAQIAPGESILIHAAAGGVGQAAVQIALAAGAEIFATAGSPVKRDWLRNQGIHHVMESRSTAFAAQILEWTNGRGVDYVLNSLSGEMIPKSLSALRPGGTFFEIGKRDIWEPSRVEQYRPGTIYHVFDLATVGANQPPLLSAMFKEMMEQFESNTLKPLNLTAFSAYRTVDAFRTMARAGHIGKIVVKLDAFQTQNGRDTHDMSDKGTILITGGLGALGMQSARWFIAKGARHIALAGRSAPSVAVLEQIADFRRDGALVEVFQADISIQRQAAGIIEEIERRLPPLRGIVHAAGILDDGALIKLDWERFRKVLAPKVDGAWNLHRITRTMPLDFFICFSSAASIFGWPGQGNYAAANAFLDMLMQERCIGGAPGLSINWGPWSESGMVSRLDNSRQHHFADLGLQAISPQQGGAFLDRLLGIDGQVLAMSVDWKRFIRSGPGAVNQLLLDRYKDSFVKVDAPNAAETQSANLYAQLIDAPPGNRMALLLEHLERVAAQVLGIVHGRRIKPDRPLKELGLDSLMAVEFRNALNLQMKRPLPATLLFDYPNLQSLAQYLFEKVFSLPASEAIDTPSESEKNSAHSDMKALTDEEAEAMLLSELQQIEGNQDD